MSRRYRTVLLDLDHTLFDFDGSHAAAFAEALDAHGIVHSASLAERFGEINRALWRRVETGKAEPAEAAALRWEQWAEREGVDAEPASLAESYVEGLARHGDLLEGARALLERLRGRARLGLVTNGLARVQRPKIARLGLATYFDAIVISEELGAAKPAPGPFRRALAELREGDLSAALMVGDSLGSDVAGARRAGLDACWFAPDGREAPPHVRPTYVARTLSQVGDFALGDG